MPSANPPAVHVAKEVIAKFGDRLHDQAICLTTPVPKLVPMSRVQLSPTLRALIEIYEPRVKKDGLYSHQAEIVNTLTGPEVPNIIMTTATGSGKSLGFWSWAFQILAFRADSSAAATFPTQALLWGQAKRLARASDSGSLVEFDGLKGASFAGTITAGGVSVPWSVWYGTRECSYMRKHQESETFKRARLRLCTLDKVHWSLLSDKNATFLTRLDGLIIDEAHHWHGLAGANVRAMMDRLHLSMDVLRRRHPALFLASATLANPTAFAEDLTGVPASSFQDVSDRGAAKGSLIAARDIPLLLGEPPEPGLLRRYIMLIRPTPKPAVASEVLRKEILGPRSNALCFVQSKFTGHRLRQQLHSALRGHDVIAYDGDLPTKQRREVEDALFAADEKPKIVVGTNALELGIDLPNLDLVVMDELPPRRHELLQRLGRVGRTFERPGLAVLCLGFSPGDERLLDEPLSAVAVDDIKAVPLPLHLEVVRLRAMTAAFREWMYRLGRKIVRWDDFNTALKRYFGWAPSYTELKEEVERQLGGVVDLDDGSWCYRGFRVSASQGKCEMVLAEDHSKVVAAIEDMAIFRDAHPEGVYLGHRSESFRVKRYIGKWDVGTWTSPSGVVLGKYMKGLKRIEVTPEEPHIATRGRWRDTFTLEERKDPASGSSRPGTGTFTFGVFTFLRKFDGYLEFDLRTEGTVTAISLSEVTQRFRDAVADGGSFPFLHDFTYRTMGWKWLIAPVLDEACRNILAPVLGPLLESFFADAVECSTSDIYITLDPEAGELRVVDATPGGNGLSEALLQNGRVATGLAAAKKAIQVHQRRGPRAFRRYLAEECRLDLQLPAAEVLDGITRLADAWNA